MDPPGACGRCYVGSRFQLRRWNVVTPWWRWQIDDRGSVSNVSIPSIDRMGHMKVAHQAVTFLLSRDRRRCDADTGCIALNDGTHRPPGIHGRDKVVPSVEEDAAQGPSITDQRHRLRGALTERLRMPTSSIRSAGMCTTAASIAHARMAGHAS